MHPPEHFPTAASLAGSHQFGKCTSIRTATPRDLSLSTTRSQAQRLEQGLRPEHGSKPGPSGLCRDCELQQAIDGGAAALSAPREVEGPPRGSCGECGCRIFLTGRALEDGLCKLCREEASVLETSSPAVPDSPAGSLTCPGTDGTPCGRQALPNRSVCARHLAQELALTNAEAS